MASNPASFCCVTGVKHEGDPQGKSFAFKSIDAYLAEACGQNVHQNTAILYLPDVIGIWQNSKLMADQFAANGYTTLMIDLFNKDPIPLNRTPGFDFRAWHDKGSSGDNPHTPEFVDPIVEKSIAFLKERGFTRIGAVGYCFGAKYVARFLASGKGLDVGYVAHPSFVSEEELANIKGPMSISAAEIDEIFPADLRRKSEEILIQTGQPFQINLFGSVSHGFAVKCDPSKKIERFSKEQAFMQAVIWMNEYLL